MVLLLAVVGVWTNVTGRAIAAEPVRIEGASVVLKTGAESERTLPLAVFPSAEQARLRAAVGEYPLSPRLHALRETYASDLARAEQRFAGGVMDEAAFAAKRARVHAAWKSSLVAAKLPLPAIAYWEERLK